MKKIFGLAILAAVLLSACSDGVPHVEDPHNPVDADGKPIKGTEFLMKYCAGKSQNETCAKVATAVSADSTKGKMPKGY
jgi:hypothetical protein